MGDEPDITELRLPLSRIMPVRLASKTPVASPGIFFPQQPSQPMMLAFTWGEGPCLLHLEGAYAFHHGRLEIGHSAKGTIIKDVEFLADLNSRYDTGKGDPMGALVMSEGRIFVMGRELGDNQSDPHAIPLWGNYGEASAETKVGFTRWTINVRDGGERVTIWPRPPATRDAD